MELNEFIEILKQRGKPESVLQKAREVLIPYLEAAAGAVELLAFTRRYVEHLSADAENTLDLIVILYWYHEQSNNQDCARYLITMLGTRKVIENQIRRVSELYGEEAATRIMGETLFPRLGTDLAAYPGAIIEYIRRMRACLSEQQCQKALAGDHHEVGFEPFAKDKQRFEESPDLETFLRQRHEEFVRVLREHARTGKIWFEQYITQEVADHVSEHQEIHTGVVQGDKLIVQKIAYAPDAWLKEQDPVLKRFYACHCPFVRYAIKDNAQLPALWCYCSGGFTKNLFDCLYGADLEVELLESVLDGSDRCRFAIHLPDQAGKTSQLSR